MDRYGRHLFLGTSPAKTTGQSLKSATSKTSKYGTPWYSTLQVVAIDLDMGFKWFYSNIYIYIYNVGTAKGWMHTSMNYDLRCVSFTAFCSSAVFFSSASIVSIKPEAPNPHGFAELKE